MTNEMVQSMKGPTVTVTTPDKPQRRLPVNPKRQRALRVNSMLCEMVETSNKVVYPLEVATGAHNEVTSLSTRAVIKDVESGKLYEVVVREITRRLP